MLNDKGYYVLIFSDVIGYCNVSILPDDGKFVKDTLDFLTENRQLDFVSYFRKTYFDTYVLVSNIVDEQGLSVYDYSGDFLPEKRLYPNNEIIKKKLFTSEWELDTITPFN